MGYKTRAATAVALLGLTLQSASSRAQSSATSTDTALRAELKAARAFQKEMMAADRRELVSPPPAGFKPLPKARAPELRLSLKSTTVKAGEHLSYSLSIFNAGSAPIRIYDQRAFFKRPTLNSYIKWEFWLTKPDGFRTRLLYGDSIEMATRRARTLPLTPMEEFNSVSTSVRRNLKQNAWESEERHTLDILLASGETLRNRACTDVESGTSAASPPVGPGFCGFPSDESPKAPGRYSLTVVMIDKSPTLPVAEGARYLADFKREHAQHLGRIESNSVEFQVIL